MFSKRALLFGSMLLTVLAGCSLQVGEKQTDEGAREIGGAEIGCLQKSSPTAKKYLEGKADEASVRKMFDCASRSLTIFAERTKGAQQGRYSPQELRSFLEKYFLGDLKVSDELLYEAMELKRSLLGGNADALTLNELQRAVKLIEVTKIQALKLRIYAPFTAQNMVGKTEEWVESAMSAFVSASENFGEALEEVGIPYSFERFERLLVAMEPLHNEKDLRERMPTIQALKAILVGTSEKEIEGKEWRQLFNVVARWYAVLLRGAYLDRNNLSFKFGRGHAFFMKTLVEARELLNESIDRHKDGVIRFAELDQLVDSFKMDSFPVGDRGAVKPETLKKTIVVLVRRILGGSDTGNQGRHADGVTRPGIDRLWEAFERWSRGQIYIEQTFRHAARLYRTSGYPIFKGQGFTPGELIGALPYWPLDVHGPYVKIIPDTPEGEVVHQILKERPLFRSEDKEMTLQQSDRMLSFHNLSEINWMRQVLRLIYLGYVDDPERALKGTGGTLKEFEVLAADIVPIGIELRILDPRAKTQVHMKRVREANLFVFSADGNESVSMDEGTELIAFMVSTKQQAARFHEKIGELCGSKDTDIFGRPLLEVNCFWKKYFESWESPRSDSVQGKFYRIDYFWDHLPGLATFYRAKKETGTGGALERALRGFVYNGQVEKDKVDSADSESMAGLLQYLEALFIRFDRNGDGAFDSDEAKGAFPIFKGILTQMSEGKLTSDHDLWLVFKYLLVYGEPPTTAQFVLWKVGGSALHSVEMDRARLIQVFSAMGKREALKKLQPAPPAPERYPQ